MTRETQAPTKPRRSLQPTRSTPTLRRLVAAIKRHPMTIGVLVLGAIGGALAAAWLPIDRPLPLRIVGGAIGGAYFALFPLGARLFQGDE